MTSLLIAFLLVLLVPLFVATWRTSLLGLCFQGILLYAMAYRMEGASWSIESALVVADLLVLRGLLAPALLYQVLQARRAPDRNDVLPANLLAWAAAVGLVLLSFRLAAVVVPVDGDGQMMIAAVASGVLLGFLMLASQTGVFSQIVGVLRIENAIALFELSGGAHEGYLGVHIGQFLVFLASVLLFAWFLMNVEVARPPVSASEEFDA